MLRFDCLVDPPPRPRATPQPTPPAAAAPAPQSHAAEVLAMDLAFSSGRTEAYRQGQPAKLSRFAWTVQHRARSAAESLTIDKHYHFHRAWARRGRVNEFHLL